MINVVSEEEDSIGKSFVPVEVGDGYESEGPKRKILQDENEFDLDEEFLDGTLAIGKNEQNVHDQMRRKEIEDAINDAQLSDESQNEEMLEWEQRQINQGALHSHTAPIIDHTLKIKKVPTLQEEIGRLQEWLAEMDLIETKAKDTRDALSLRGQELERRKAELVQDYENVMKKYAE